MPGNEDRVVILGPRTSDGVGETLVKLPGGAGRRAFENDLGAGGVAPPTRRCPSEKRRSLPVLPQRGKPPTPTSRWQTQYLDMDFLLHSLAIAAVVVLQHTTQPPRAQDLTIGFSNVIVAL